LRYHVPAIPAEAMATGRCVLMSEEVHQKEPYKKLKNGKEVIVVNALDANEIKKPLERLIRKPDIAENIGANACNAISQNVQIESYTDETIQIYKSVLQ
jgi:glycosyltransferase involved in cell wall biosynthesis